MILGLLILYVTVMPTKFLFWKHSRGDRIFDTCKGVSANTSVAVQDASHHGYYDGTGKYILPIEDGDIDATEATLRWVANSEVTSD